MEGIHTSKRIKIAAFITVILVIIAGIAVWFIFYKQPKYPDTLPAGQNPALILPLYDFSHNDYIQGFGQISPTYYHNGFDFGVNSTTDFVASFDAYVTSIKKNWYNEKGEHWQTNVQLRLNAQWSIEMGFESWATNEMQGTEQANAIAVTVGQYVAANQSIGNLLCHGESAHVHFSVKSYGTDVCPYYYFTPSAKAAFETQFCRVNITRGWDM